MLALAALGAVWLSDDTGFARVGLRAFKAERQLEVWASSRQAGPMRLVATFPIAGMSGTAGPKRREGDGQVPEGFYRVDRFNPKSRFHLSLGLDYPNESDRIKGDRVRPGTDIFIHGGNVSIGCLAMTDPVIERIYAWASRARAAVRVEIYPCRLESPTIRQLQHDFPQHAEFWQSLATGSERFRCSHQFSTPNIDRAGNYVWPRIRR